MPEKKHEDADDLRNELRLYKKFVEDSKDIFTLFDENLNLVYANKRFLELAEVDSFSDVEGMNVREIVHDERLGKLKGEINSYGKAFIELKVFTAQKGIIDISHRFEREYDAEGNLIGVWGISRDITEKKKLERELIKSEKKYKSIFENSGDANVVLDEEGNILEVNKKFKEFFDYDTSEVRGLRFTDIVPEEERSRLNDYRYKRISGGSPPSNYETFMYTKNGVRREVNLSANLEPDTKNILVSLRDITEKKELERDLEEVLRGNNHDIKNAVGIVQMAAKMLKQGFREELVDMIINGSNQALDIIDDTTEYFTSKSEAYSFSEYNMYDIVEKVIKNESFRISEKKIHVDNKIPTELNVYCDKSKMKRVWTNYLTNSIKYCREDSNDRFTEIGVNQGDEEYEFYIRDNGIGISEENIRDLGQAYTRLKVKKGVKGTGLGLAIVGEIISKHGGSTRVESDGLGEGSTFYFTLSKE